MLQVLFGLLRRLKNSDRMIDNLLNAGALELRYSDLNWAIDRLARLAEEGHVVDPGSNIPENAHHGFCFRCAGWGHSCLQNA